jgi:hypothetical protein
LEKDGRDRKKQTRDKEWARAMAGTNGGSTPGSYAPLIMKKICEMR